MIRVFLTGEHARRTPLSYPVLASLWEKDIVFVDRPDAADLYVFAHVLDIQTAPHSLVLDWRRRQVPVVLLSEEPFWDTIWGRHPLDPIIYVDTGLGTLPVHQITHQTSDVFGFDHLPYYLLTHERFIHTYRDRFARNALVEPEVWRERFAARAIRVSFMFERRPEPVHDVSWPEADLIGLCAWRTRLAEAMTTPDVERLGRSWQGGVRRQDLPDWHADKLTQLDNRACFISAYENTHEHNYLTEKLFDAFACGAMPLYYAGPTHRIHDLGLHPDSWLNSYGLSADDAALAVQTYVPDSVFFEGFHQAQNRLAVLFAEDALITSERQRLRRAVLSALTRLLETPL